MAETLICARCGEANPADARFCIECAAPVAAQAATGATVKLKGNACPACGSSNPAHARFCISCGRSLGEAGPQMGQQGYRPQPTATRPQPRIYPRVNTPPLYVPQPPQQVAPQRGYQGNIGPMVAMGLLFMVVALFATRAGWPLFVLFLPLGLFGHMFRRGGNVRSWAPVFWIVGLLFLIGTKFFWPGILLLWLVWAMISRW